MKTKSMMDCIDLVTNELGLEKVGKAIVWTDKKYSNEWSLHLNEIEAMQNDQRYHVDQNFRDEISTLHFNKLYAMIARYKHESTYAEEILKNEFDNFFAKD